MKQGIYRCWVASIFLVLACTLAGSGWAAEESGARVKYSPSQYLKNFAFSVCLANSLEAESARVEAQDAAGGYLELGSLGIEAYQEAAGLAKQFAAKQYQSHHGGKLNVMKCIDLLHSAQLEKICRKYQAPSSKRK